MDGQTRGTRAPPALPTSRPLTHSLHHEQSRYIVDLSRLFVSRVQRRRTPCTDTTTTPDVSPAGTAAGAAAGEARAAAPASDPAEAPGAAPEDPYPAAAAVPARRR